MKPSRFHLPLLVAGVALVLFSLTRILLLVVSWGAADLSTTALMQSFITGFLFDAGFCAYALIPAILYLWLVPQRIWSLRWHRYWVQSLLLVSLYALGFIVAAEYLFWEEFSVRFNFIAIDYLIYQHEVTNNILESYPVLPLLAFILCSTLALFYLLRRPITRALMAEESLWRRSLTAGLLLVLPLIAYVGLNQDLRHLSDNVYQNELASNGPYQFLAAFRNNELDYRQFYASAPPAEASARLRSEVAEPNATFVSDELFDIRRDIVAAGPEKRLNVVLVMVESLSSDFLTFFGNPRQLTPNLDALIDKSLFFTRFYATGTRTTRGLEAVTLSMPPTPGRSIVKRIGREGDQWSLGNVLNSKGYHSSFLYGGRSYFDNMNAFFSGNGYEVIDQSSVPDAELGFTNAWGMADADLYRQAIKAADRSYADGRPFLLQLMTTSNHRPYTYPDGQIDIPSGTGRDGAVKYTDHAIGTFLAEAEQQPWFDNTLFVIVADHQANSAGKSALPIERYHIPLWIYAPKQIKPRQIDTLSSQIDLAPTLLGLLDMSYRSAFFGLDILKMSHDRERALIGNYQNLGLFDGKELAILSPQRAMHLQEGIVSGEVVDHLVGQQDGLVQRDISYYQGAAYVYHNQLNAWPKPPIQIGHATVKLKPTDLPM